MGLELTWREEDRINFGNCGRDLEKIVKFTLSEISSVKNGGITDSPERDSWYVLNDKRIWPVKDLDLPKGELGYAIEYTEMEVPLTREEIEDRLRKNLARGLPKDILEGDKKKFIEESVSMYFRPGTIFSVGTSFIEGMTLKDGEAWTKVKKFVRWVSKEEYERKAEEAKKMDKGEDDDIMLFDNWYSGGLTLEERNEKCSNCPLSTFLGPKTNPYVNGLKERIKGLSKEKKRSLLDSVYKQLVDEEEGEYNRLVNENSEHSMGLVRFVLDEMEDIPEQKARKIIKKFGLVGNEVRNCYRGSSYSHWGEFIDFIARHGNFSVLTHKYLNSGGGIPVENIDDLERELTESRKILKKKVPAMNVYDLKGKKLRKVVHDTGTLYGNETYGYGMGLEGERFAITVTHQSPSVFSMPTEVRRKVLKEEGLDGIMRISAEIAAEKPRFYFAEIYRQGNTFYGKTENGGVVELPHEKGNKGGGTPFSGFRDHENIGRVEITSASAMESFGYLQKLLEKHLEIAKKFMIPIKGA